VLVVAQIALSTVLLIGSSLLVRSMRQLLHTDLGLDRDHLLIVHAATSRTSYGGQRLIAFETELRDRALSVPGVDAASYSETGPFSGGESAGHVVVPGFATQADSESEIYYDRVGPEYFRAIGARLLRGRDFTPADIAAKAAVGVIDATMAKAYFRDRDPIGRTVSIDAATYTVVGVVKDVEYSDARAQPVRRLFVPGVVPPSRPASFELQLHVRTDPARFVEPVRRALSSADHTVPLEITPLADRVRATVSRDTLLMQVTTSFGAITLLLAALGLYGITAYATTQRTSEFGLRIALGADPRHVAGIVLRDALLVVTGGIAIGLPIGLVATHSLRGALYGLGPLDAPSLGIAIATLALTALVASYLPAWRAAKVSPLQALRNDN
jgi:predicted permease